MIAPTTRASNSNPSIRAAISAPTPISPGRASAQRRSTSNQFLFGSDEIDYIARHYIYTDHAQTWTGSAGASYVFRGTRASVDMIYGSGLRSGFANTTHVSPYTQVNLGLSREIPVPWGKPLTFRFDVVNLLDHSYTLARRLGHWRVRSAIWTAPRLFRRAETGVLTAARDCFAGSLNSKRLQEVSERFQRRFGNVMLNPLGIGFGNLGGDTQRDK